MLVNRVTDGYIGINCHKPWLLQLSGEIYKVITHKVTYYSTWIILGCVELPSNGLWQFVKAHDLPTVHLRILCGKGAVLKFTVVWNTELRGRVSLAMQECKCNGGFELETNSVINKLSCVRMASVNRTVRPATYHKLAAIPKCWAIAIRYASPAPSSCHNKTQVWKLHQQSRPHCLLLITPTTKMPSVIADNHSGSNSSRADFHKSGGCCCVVEVPPAELLWELQEKSRASNW